MATTQQWPYGCPGSPYGSFAGKSESSGGSKPYTATFTRLAVFGGIGLPYGNFAGKGAAPVPAPVAGGGRAWPIEEKKPRERKRERVEVLAPALRSPKPFRVRRVDDAPPAIEPTPTARAVEPVLRVRPVVEPAPAPDVDPGPLLDGKVLEADFEAAQRQAMAAEQAAARQAAEAIALAKEAAAADLETENARRRALLVALAIALEV
jgi:hypothetical protein